MVHRRLRRRDCSTHELDVAGARIRYLVWEPSVTTRRSPLLLLHGSSAHAQWWTHVAGILATDRRVVAIDLSGHGDSARRPVYDLELWADELLEIAAVVGPRG